MPLGERNVLVIDADGSRRFVSAFEAGQMTRRDPDFLPRGLGPNAIAELGSGGLELVVRRSRDLMDNNEYVANAVEGRVESIVGVGIDDLEPATGFEELDAAIARLLEWAARAVDPCRLMSLGESQRLFQTEVEVAGGVLVHYTVAKARTTVKGKWPAMPAIELIEFERMPLDLSGQVPQGQDGAGNHVRQGVEVDGDGCVVAYHVLTHHPRDYGTGSWLGGFAGAFGGSASIGSKHVRRITADRAHLVGRRRRIGELRHVPRASTVTGTVRTEKGFTESSMDQARLAASMGVFFTGVNPQLWQNNPSAFIVDANGQPILNVTGMQMGFLPPGAEMKVVGANLPGPTFETTIKSLLRRMSRGLRAPYSSVAGDASDASFSAIRAEQMEARGNYKVEQRGTYLGHSEPWVRRVIDYGLMTGKIRLSREHRRAFEEDPERLYKVSVGYPSTGFVDPKAEASATMMDIQSGVTSAIQAIAERGGNWKDVVTDRIKFAAEVKKQMAAMGLTPADMAVATAVAASGGGANAGKKSEDGGERGGGGGGGGGDGGGGGQDDSPGGEDEGDEGTEAGE